MDTMKAKMFDRFVQAEDVITDLTKSLKEFMDIWGSGDGRSESKRAQGRRARMWEKANAALVKVEDWKNWKKA